MCGIKASLVSRLSLANRRQEWDLCIPDNKLEAACRLFLDSAGDGAKYKTAKPPPPVPWDRRHACPCFQLIGYNFWFILVPSSDCLVDPSDADHVERSKNGVPYVSLVQFARSLLVQGLTPDLSDFIDGMDLTIEWGAEHIGFKALQEENTRFVALRNQRVNDSSGGDYGYISTSQPLEQLWNNMASKEAKERRIEPMKHGRYYTRWRRIKSPEDPRTRDRPV